MTDSTLYNPSAGKLLGYVYRNPGAPDQVIDGIGIKMGPNEAYYALPGTKPDFVSEGIAYAITKKGTENEWAVPIAQPGQFESISTTPMPGAAKIPIYEPPINLSYGGKQLNDQDKYQLGAALAGASDATPPKTVRTAGALDSNYVSTDVRSSLGLPKSFDMLANVDPTSSDWGMKQATVWNPTSGGFGGDLADFLTGPAGKVAALAGAVIGGPSALSALKGAETAGAPMLSDAVIDKALNQALQGAITSGAISGGTAALTGGDPLQAALKGAIGGGLSGGISGLAAPLVQQLELPAAAGSALTGAITGAGKAALTGGNILQNALTGGVTSGIGSLASQIPGISSLPEGARNAIASGLASAAGAALTGGASPLISAIAGGLAGLASPSAPAAATPAQPAQAANSLDSLLSLLALSKSQQAPAPAPAPAVVPEIKPYEFSENLLEGIYQPRSVYGANDELLRLARGQK